MSFTDVIPAALPAIAAIETPSGLGSGFCVDPRGIIVTNHHVVAPYREAVIRLHDGTETVGKIVRSVRSVDLAFVLVEPGPDFVALPLAESVRAGQDVIVLGHPATSLGDVLYDTATSGIVSAPERFAFGGVFLQISAPLNPGNSGGPVLNRIGEVVGVSTSRMPDSTGHGFAQGIFFAVPVQALETHLSQLRAHHSELSSIVYCAACGHSNTATARYCATCGTALTRGSDEEYSRWLRHRQPARQRQAGSWSCSTGRHNGTGPAPRYCPTCGALTASGASDHTTSR